MPPRVDLDTLFSRWADVLYDHWPQPMPPRHRLTNCKLVAHRGAHDNRRWMENTLPAFDRALDHGLWGIELDIRWTKDLHPVVIHDPTLERMFGSPQPVASLPLAVLNKNFPQVPTLAEVVRRYGKRLHLMIEIKAERYPKPDLQNRILNETLKELSPTADFHLITLTPEMFNLIQGPPPEAFLLVARTNTRALSKIALHKGYGGLLGHYLFITRSIRRKHHLRGQHVGIGYVKSKNCLCRELNRGSKWIFTNDALELQNVLHAMSKRI